MYNKINKKEQNHITNKYDQILVNLVYVAEQFFINSPFKFMDIVDEAYLTKADREEKGVLRKAEYKEMLEVLKEYDLNNIENYYENFNPFAYNTPKYFGLARKMQLTKNFVLAARDYLNRRDVVNHFVETKGELKADDELNKKLNFAYEGKSWVEFIKFVGGYEEIREQEEFTKSQKGEDSMLDR